MRTKKTIKLKDYSVIPAGSKIICFESDRIMQVLRPDGGTARVRITSGFNRPPNAKLEKWALGGVCRSVLGAKVEPDGHGPNGEPSWLLALGLI